MMVEERKSARLAQKQSSGDKNDENKKESRITIELLDDHMSGNVNGNDKLTREDEIARSFLRLETRMCEKLSDLKLLINSTIPNYVASLEECFIDDIISIKKVLIPGLNKLEVLDQSDDMTIKKEPPIQDQLPLQFWNPVVNDSLIDPEVNNTMIEDKYNSLIGRLDQFSKEEIDNIEARIEEDEAPVPILPLDVSITEKNEEDAKPKIKTTYPLIEDILEDAPSSDKPLYPLVMNPTLPAEPKEPSKLDEEMTKYEIHTMYNCNYCPNNDEQKGKLKLHIIKTHENSMSRVKGYKGTMMSKIDFFKSFKCPKCPRHIRKKVDIIEHVKGKHENIKGLTCEFCGFTSAYRKHMNNHINNIHHKEDRIRYHCDQCDASYYTENSLKNHGHEAHGIKLENEYKCEFEGCGRTFGIRENFLRHSREFHKHNETVCDECGANLKHMKSYRRHMQQVHLKIKKYVCRDCDYKAATTSSLGDHVRTVHDNLKPFLCQVPKCTYATGRKNNLKLHNKSVHLKIKEKICTDCGYAAGTTSDLAKHANAVHLHIKRFKCEEIGCEFISNQKSGLTFHFNAVHLKIQKHVCEKCEFKTAYKDKLQKHQRRAHKDLIMQV